MTDFLASAQLALGLPAEPVHEQGRGALPSAFAVTAMACASVAAAGQAVAQLLLEQTGQRPEVSVDRRLASFWFATSLRPIGWTIPPLWDPIAGDYACRDGWIRLHTNAPQHRASVERVLGHCTDRATLATRVTQWRKGDLEQAVVAAGGCAAQMRTQAAWQVHPQGQAVNAEPLIMRSDNDSPAPLHWLGTAQRPLAGVKVLDLTRVLAGPVASRLLAGLGAQVLRIDPPTWSEPGVVPEVTLGKRCAHLDLHVKADRETFERLLGEADILLHGYRADALERLGYDPANRQRLAPGLIDVGLNAYGWSGPWRNRRGFDSLVQMSSGIAEAGMHWKGASVPTPLPVQALDHATGYLIAAAAVRALSTRLQHGIGGSARLSLARTAKWLMDGTSDQPLPLAPPTPADEASTLEMTAWGPARRLQAPLQIAGAPLQWPYPAGELGSSPPRW